MRPVTAKEKRKRGCQYCLDYKRGGCKHDKCPYHQLDEYKTYEEFFKDQEKKCKLGEILLD